MKGRSDRNQKQNVTAHREGWRMMSKVFNFGLDWSHSHKPLVKAGVSNKLGP